jgi:anaerobic selenocysteine-containing dehydrogenase
MLGTRRGKQFNSMVHENKDALNGATREAVLMSPVDADRLGLDNGDEVLLSSETGSMHARVLRAPIAPGNLQVHWPEGEVLLDPRRRSPQAKIPDYKSALVTLSRP